MFSEESFYKSILKEGEPEKTHILSTHKKESFNQSFNDISPIKKEMKLNQQHDCSSPFKNLIKLEDRSKVGHQDQELICKNALLSSSPIHSGDLTIKDFQNMSSNQPSLTENFEIKSADAKLQ